MIPASIRWLAAGILWVAAGACAPLLAPEAPAPKPRWPIALITLGGLRMDAASEGPRLLELAANSSWTGKAVAASSDPQVSLTSLLTGVRPWQHQLLSSEMPRRRPFPTLAGLLRRAGYRSAAHVPEYLHDILTDDFDQRFTLPKNPAVAATLSPLSEHDFVWIHLPHAELTHGGFERASGSSRVLRRRLLRYADPAVPLPPSEHRQLWREYRKSVGRLDEILRQLLNALRRGPHGEHLVVAVAGSHGQEFGEHGQVLFGENLGRETIEVPIYLDLPPKLADRITVPTSQRVALPRLFATLAEAAGIEPAPVHPPSLFRVSDDPILSELYAKNGVNRFSLLAGDLQLHWTTSFAEPDPEYWSARQARAGARRNLTRPPVRILSRLLGEFDRSAPLSGREGSSPHLRLERWVDNSTLELEDPDRTRALALELRRRFTRFVDRERSPADERRFAALVVPPP